MGTFSDIVGDRRVLRGSDRKFGNPYNEEFITCIATLRRAPGARQDVIRVTEPRWTRLGWHEAFMGKEGSQYRFLLTC
jgi:hypothetical protein